MKNQKILSFGTERESLMNHLLEVPPFFSLLMSVCIKYRDSFNKVILKLFLICDNATSRIISVDKAISATSNNALFEETFYNADHINSALL